MILVSTTVSAVTVGPKLIPYRGFEDPARWDVGTNSSAIENWYLIVINHSGFIFPERGLVTDAGTAYQYSMSVDPDSNLTGGGKVTVGGQTIWQPGYNTGMFTGTIVATVTSGLVFNILTPCAGQAEVDSLSIKAILVTPILPSFWLLRTGLPGIIVMAMMKSFNYT